MIVMPDADLGQAVDALIGAGYGSAGERCMAISVAVPVGEETADRLVARLKERIAMLRIGASDDPDAEFGPLVSQDALDRVRRYVDIGVTEGAELVVDGRDFTFPGYENGFFAGASLFDRVAPAMRIYREEIFGSVLCVVRAADYEEALRLPSEHPYGNGVALFTRDGDIARDFTRRVNTGMVGVNVPIPVPVAYLATTTRTEELGGGALRSARQNSIRDRRASTWVRATYSTAYSRLYSAPSALKRRLRSPGVSVIHCSPSLPSPTVPPTSPRETAIVPVKSQSYLTVYIRSPSTVPFHTVPRFWRTSLGSSKPLQPSVVTHLSFSR